MADVKNSTKTEEVNVVPTPLNDEQNDFEMRSKQAHDEISLILKKYELTIRGQLDVTVNGVIPKAVYADEKKAPNA